MSQGGNEERTGPGEGFVDVQISRFVAMKLQAGNRILGELTWRSMRAEVTSGVGSNESVFIDECQIVG